MYKDREAHLANMRRLVGAQKESRKTCALDLLGGRCTECGSGDRLEFDHIDPDTKYMGIGKLWRAHPAVFWSEVNKCQLLCYGCHKKKTSVQLKSVPVKHGTLTGHSRCKPPCRSCSDAKNAYKREYRKKRVLRGLSPI